MFLCAPYSEAINDNQLYQDGFDLSENMTRQTQQHDASDSKDNPKVSKTSKQQNAKASKAAQKSTTGYEPLFGKANASFQIISSELKGATFYLVSGHGGPDPGAIGKLNGHELHEDEYAYDIILRLARNLMARGAKVNIIIQDKLDGIRDDKYLSNSKRETCMGATIPLNQVKRLQQRSSKINTLAKTEKNAYKRVIYIHVDSRSKKHQTDVFFYYKKNDSRGQSLARTMRTTFQNKYKRHQPGRGFSGTVDSRSLYVLNNTAVSGVFVEVGNIQNSYDQQRIVLKDNRQALANWLCEGFVTDYKSHKKK
jgi:N-acetylmuramoyl-L-alanine amidase